MFVRWRRQRRHRVGDQMYVQKSSVSTCSIVLLRSNSRQHASAWKRPTVFLRVCDFALFVGFFFSHHRLVFFFCRYTNNIVTCDLMWYDAAYCNGYLIPCLNHFYFLHYLPAFFKKEQNAHAQSVGLHALPMPHDSSSAEQPPEPKKPRGKKRKAVTQRGNDSELDDFQLLTAVTYISSNTDSTNK